MFRSTTIIRESQCPYQSHYYLNHSCTYSKRGGVAAYRIVWIGLCLRSFRVCVFLLVLWTTHCVIHSTS